MAVTVHLRECRGRRLEIRPQLASNHTEGILKGTKDYRVPKNGALELENLPTKDKGLDR